MSINVVEAIQNAQECDDGSLDWQAGNDGSDDPMSSLPWCLYTFTITDTTDRTKGDK